MVVRDGCVRLGLSVIFACDTDFVIAVVIVPIGDSGSEEAALY